MDSRIACEVTVPSVLDNHSVLSLERIRKATDRRLIPVPQYDLTKALVASHALAYYGRLAVAF